ncbi:hypothetical protein [Actinophytocola sp.]|uniref:hypothetical protein n=1 Tax=Actinophytocola sp. TaxID=1872138 RepID=UPI00389B1F16
MAVSIDSAENLLDPDTGKVTDPDLDEALEMLATEPGHRVTVLLVSHQEPESPADGIWPTAETPRHVGELSLEEFLPYLATLDRHGRTDPAGLPEGSRVGLYKSS